MEQISVNNLSIAKSNSEATSDELQHSPFDLTSSPWSRPPLLLPGLVRISPSCQMSCEICVRMHKARGLQFRATPGIHFGGGRSWPADEVGMQSATVLTKMVCSVRTKIHLVATQPTTLSKAVMVAIVPVSCGSVCSSQCSSGPSLRNRPRVSSRRLFCRKEANSSKNSLLGV